jgi:predicted nucleic acid-binding protein
MRILVDTSILGRLCQPDHEHHGPALSAIRILGQNGFELRLVPQVIYEFWVVGTRPVMGNGLGLEVADVRSRVDDFLDVFPLLRDERGIFEPWLTLVNQVACRGRLAHDARLVAAMTRHGCSHILTFNVADFERLASVGVLSPLQLPSAIFEAD